MFESLVYLQLLFLNIDNRPIYTFDYFATTEYGNIEMFNGTHFYELEFPNIQLATFYCSHSEKCGSVFLDTGYVADKQRRSPKVVWEPQMAFELRENIEMTLTPTIEIGGTVHLKPCVDSLKRQFHCYYGTQPQLPLFNVSYDTIANSFERRFIRMDKLEIKLEWTF